MINLIIKNSNKGQATISVENEKLVVHSDDSSWTDSARKIIAPLARKGIIIFSEPNKTINNTIEIIRKRIYADDPRFLGCLSEELRKIGYEVELTEEKKFIERKKLENEIRRLLDQLPTEEEGMKAKAIIPPVIGKLTDQQLATVKEDLNEALNS